MYIYIALDVRALSMWKFYNNFFREKIPKKFLFCILKNDNRSNMRNIIEQ